MNFIRHVLSVVGCISICAGSSLAQEVPPHDITPSQQGALVDQMKDSLILGEEVVAGVRPAWMSVSRVDGTAGVVHVGFVYSYSTNSIASFKADIQPGSGGDSDLEQFSDFENTAIATMEVEHATGSFVSLADLGTWRSVLTVSFRR